MKVAPDTLVIVHPSCVQTAVSAENASCDVRATRKLPDVLCTSAEPPTVANGEPEPTVTEIVRFDTVPVSAGRLVPAFAPLGDVVLPPHACMTDPTATNDIALHA